ncbi:hypothetical protein F4809DRAFT_605324 [Biscogniauxia mediterranea]|nr:hypothetical protein F4809DRAFT_605324 [Biscogniauxia mediterranea]
MSSSPPPLKPYSLQVAERFHYATGKEYLPRICAGGFLLETLWHTTFERKVLKTPGPKVRRAIVQAAVFWPTVYIGTAMTLKWAEWRVNRAERAEREK